MTDNQDGILAEYNSLRQEILGYQRDSMNILAFAGMLSAFSFGYAVNAQDGLYFYILTLLLVAPQLLQVQRLRSTYRIGRYIQIFLESPEAGLQYETRWMRLKRKHPWHEAVYTFKYAVSVPVILLQVAATFFMLHFYKGETYLLIWLLGTSGAILIYEIFLIARSDHVDDIMVWLSEVKQVERISEIKKSSNGT